MTPHPDNQDRAFEAAASGNPLGRFLRDQALVILDGGLATALEAHGHDPRLVKHAHIPHAKALVNALRKGMPHKPNHSEGFVERRWIVLDYGDFVVHVFEREARQFYDIESLWADHIVERLADIADDGPAVGAGGASSI